MTPSGDLDLLEHRLRPSEAETPSGALILFHGRGADHNDLFGLIDVFDPERRLVAATPRAPLQLPPGGFHWYVSAGIPTPHPDTFLKTYGTLERWLAAFRAGSGVPISRTVIGGFSQGTVMTYAMGLGKGRPRPAGIMAFSGFMPEVDGFDLDLGNASGLPVVIGHGTADTVIGVEWGRGAKQRLEAAGAQVTYAETPMGHSIDPRFASTIPAWIKGILGPRPA